MADPHYDTGAHEPSAPQIPPQYDPPQQLQQQQSYQGLQQQGSYDPQPLVQEAINYQPDGQQQDYPPDQVDSWYDDCPPAPIEQQNSLQYSEDVRVVSNRQPQREFSYEQPPQAQGNRLQEYPQNQRDIMQDPERDQCNMPYRPQQPQQPQQLQQPQQQQSHQSHLPPQQQPRLPPQQQQQYQVNPQEEYQRDSYGQYRPIQDTRYPVAEPNPQEYWDDYPHEFSPVREYQPAPRYESRELDNNYDPLPPPKEHMRYEPYPEPESDIRYEGRSPRYDHVHPSNKGYRNSFPESQMDPSYMRAADRFPSKEQRARYDSGMDGRREPHRGDRYRSAKPPRHAYASHERSRPREEFSNGVPRFEAYRPVEPPARHKYVSPDRNRYRFDEMAKALPRVDLNKQSKYSDRGGLRRSASNNVRNIAPDYGYKRSSKRPDYSKEPRRREMSPPVPPPKPRYSHRQLLQEPPSPREKFPHSRRSRDRY